MTFKLEQYSKRTKFMAKVADDIILATIGKWNNLEDKPMVFSHYLSKNFNRNYVTFSPNLVSPNSEKCLGYYHAEYNNNHFFFSDELLSESVSYDTFKEVVEHEVAHFIDEQLYHHMGHDGSFKYICEAIGIEQSNASLTHKITQVEQTSHVLNKVKKLLALSESDNVNEASLAWAKAKELMQSYGIHDTSNNESNIYRIGLVRYKKYTQELKTVANIACKISGCWLLLSNDGVASVAYAHGTKTECEVASYLFDYLQKELERYYKEAKKSNNFSYGSKTSFYAGVSRSMHERFKKQEVEATGTEVVEYQEENGKLAKQYIYGFSGFRTTRSKVNVSDRGAYDSGINAGKNVAIRGGISSTKNSNLYLT
jgi:predicted SprT family Zn-dependent metalloprotease